MGLPREAALLLLLLGLTAPGLGAKDPDTKKVRKSSCYHSWVSEKSIYDFTLKDVYGAKDIPLSNFKGNVTLIVNVASY
jgi:hypothetical protein